MVESKPKQPDRIISLPGFGGRGLNSHRRVNMRFQSSTRKFANPSDLKKQNKKSLGEYFKKDRVSTREIR